MSELTFRQVLPVTPSDALAWHARPGAIARLTPPWERLEVLQEATSLTSGQAEFLVSVGPWRRTWSARHAPFPDGFQDTQEQGPFASFEHTRRFLPGPAGATILEERVRYRMPGGLPGGLVRARLERMFAYRHAILAHDLALAPPKPRTILVSGASGFIASALLPFWTTQGHRVLRLVRRVARDEGERSWDPTADAVDPTVMEGVDAVVHLAGESISHRWTEARKREIMASRAKGTRILAEAAAKARNGPRAFLCASAIGLYGDRGDETLGEDAPRGAGFLPDVVEAWEGATRPATDAGIRVVNARFGIVISPRGGALPRLLLPARLGGGGPIGSGRQWWSWVDIEDVVGAFDHALRHENLRGPMVVAAPNPVRCAEFAKTLGRVLHRPSFFPLPAFAARLVMGEMADELLLFSTRCAPRALEASGYRFQHAELEGALRHQLGKPSAVAA